MKSLVFVILALSVIGCKSSTEPTSPSIEEEFRLKYGQSVKLKNEPLTIKFKSIVEDSRCPTGAVCVWEGNAKIVIQVSQQDVELNSTFEPKEAIYQEYTIRLLAVNPYPKLNIELKPADYIITLIVTKR